MNNMKHSPPAHCPAPLLPTAALLGLLGMLGMLGRRRTTNAVASIPNRPARRTRGEQEGFQDIRISGYRTVTNKKKREFNQSGLWATVLMKALLTARAVIDQGACVLWCSSSSLRRLTNDNN